MQRASFRHVLAIGVSTGGPKALSDILPHLPSDLPAPVLIVQHMPASFTRLLAERLQEVSPLEIREAREGEVLRTGVCLIAPGDYHMAVEEAGGALTVRLLQTPPENSCRPAVDVLFRSLASSVGKNTIGVVLTGIGQDGLRGAQALKEQRATLLVQDEASSTVWGMPGAIAKEGLANHVLPLLQIPQQILTLLHHRADPTLLTPFKKRQANARAALPPVRAALPPPPAAPSSTGRAPPPLTPPLTRPTSPPAAPAPPRASELFSKTLPSLRTPGLTSGLPKPAAAAAAGDAHISPSDFGWVRELVKSRAAIVLEDGKEYLCESRLTQLASRLSFSSVAQLLDAARRRADIQTEIIDSMTTNETSFFRDFQPFEALKSKIFPELIERRRSERALRLWCGASSSGQEPYTIAMLMKEYFPELNNWDVTFIASDISQQMLTRCRQGRYSQLEVHRGIPEKMRERYFQEVGKEWEVTPTLKKWIDFRQINLAGPWPSFPPLDVIFLRNVLIYFDNDTKKNIFQRIRQYLRKDGYLVLGNSETTFGFDKSFRRTQIERSNFFQPS